MPHYTGSLPYLVFLDYGHFMANDWPIGTDGHCLFWQIVSQI